MKERESRKDFFTLLLFYSSTLKAEGGEQRYIMKKLRIKGFTMIELLIVIAVLGVLAVAVLSAINPIEQINRGRDTGSRSDAEQLLSAIDRYYTTKEMYPWQTDPDDNEAQPFTTLVDETWVNDADPPVAVLEKLSTGGTAEIKESFVTRLESLPLANKLRAYHEEDGSVYICFQARSGSFDEEGQTRCTNGLPGDLDEAATICPTNERAFVCLP